MVPLGSQARRLALEELSTPDDLRLARREQFRNRVACTVPADL